LEDNSGNDPGPTKKRKINPKTNGTENVTKTSKNTKLEKKLKLLKMEIIQKQKKLKLPKQMEEGLEPLKFQKWNQNQK